MKRDPITGSSRNLYVTNPSSSLHSHPLASDPLAKLPAAPSDDLLAVVNAVPALISYLTPEGRYQFCNRAYTDWFGVSPDQLVGRRVAEFVGESMWRVSEPRFQQALAGRTVEYEVEAHYTTGPRRWVHVSYTPHRRADGAIAGVVAMISDITPRKAAEEAARAADERMQLAMSIAEAGTWDVDLVTGKGDWSDSYHCLLGREPATDSEGSLAMWEERVVPEHLALLRVEWKRAEQERDRLYSEHRLRTPGGELIWVRMAGRFFYDDAGRAVRFVGVYFDITEAKDAGSRMEQLVRDRTADLRVKLSELEAFSYSLSHDLRAPLRSMFGFAQVLLEEHAADLKPEAREYLRRIVRGAQRLDQLVRDVLTYSHVTKQQFELMPIDLSTVLDDVVQALDPHTARLNIERPLPRVEGHEALLMQLFSNLLANALKFIRLGQAPVVHIHSRQEGEFVRICVDDEGIGIAPEHFDRIFAIFGRVYPETEYEGTGIGLAIVRKAAERMGGAVGVESQLGQGTRFWVDLRPART